MRKLTIEFNDQMDKLLSDLAQERGLTKVDVLRRAVALYDYVQRETAPEKGQALAIVKDSQPVREIVLT